MFFNNLRLILTVETPAQVSHKKSVAGRIKYIRERIDTECFWGKFKYALEENENPEVISYFVTQGYGFNGFHLTW